MRSVVAGAGGWGECSGACGAGAAFDDEAAAAPHRPFPVLPALRATGRGQSSRPYNQPHLHWRPGGCRRGTEACQGETFEVELPPVWGKASPKRESTQDTTTA